MRAIQALVLSLVLAPAIPAAAPTLDIKPGLWERITTFTVEGDSEPPPMNLEGLTPEQRARVEQRLANRGQPITRKTLQCVTPEQVAEWSSFEEHERETPECRRSFSDQTPQHVRYTASCDAGRLTGEFEFTSTSSERVVARMSVVERVDGGMRRVKTEWQGRWLAAECGDIAPGKTKQVN